MRKAKPCGCEQGGMGLIIGTICCTAYFLWTGSWHTAGRVELWSVVAFLVLTTGIGKIIGIQIENRRLREAQSGLHEPDNSQQASSHHSHSKTQTFWNSDPTHCCGRK